MRKNIKILFRGLWRTLCGTGVTSGLIASGINFSRVCAEDGYTAVVRFGVAVLAMILSLILMWFMGSGRKHPKEER